MKPFTVNRMISLLYRYGQIYISNHLKPYKIATGDHSVLLVVRDEPGITQDLVSKRLFIDKGTTARIVKRLERSGYLIRETDFIDKRFNHLYPTELAVQAAEDITKVLDDWYEKLAENFSQTEKDQCYFLLAKMHDNAVKYVRKCDNIDKCNN